MMIDKCSGRDPHGNILVKVSRLPLTDWIHSCLDCSSQRMCGALVVCVWCSCGILVVYRARVAYLCTCGIHAAWAMVARKHGSDKDRLVESPLSMDITTECDRGIRFRSDRDKQLIATDGEQVIAVPPCADTAALAPCNHEEADTRMMLHAAAAMKSGHRRVLIRTVDTDVVVLAVWMAQELNEVVDELWLAFGTGKNFCYIAAHELSATLGPDKAKALPIFHAITGCDTVSSFAGRGKKTAWAVWETFPEVTNAFLDLASAPSEISEDTLATLERYVVLLYDRTCTCSEVNLARKKLFAKKSRSIEAIPPTQAALVQHVKRATYQGGHCWEQSLVPHCYLPSPCDWGWVDNDGQFDPLWTTLPEAAKSCYELNCCGCEKGCSGRCKCKKAALKCTALCACDGDCSH
uniref:uncharacterized protein n=1 Tax=Myxine glutinosa TaxID=7769 RepID=UPI00358E0007